MRRRHPARRGEARRNAGRAEAGLFFAARVAGLAPGAGRVFSSGRVHDITLITTIAFGLTGALIFGLTAKRIGLSPIVG